MLRSFALYLPHLRLAFQLTLAPIFLWGALLSGGEATWQAAAAFVSLHLFLYPAATAFNSVYDRDEGPVGGMAAPPPVPEGLLAFALCLGALGAVPAAAAGVEFLVCYALAAGWTAAYSHPLTRWKAGPVSSALAIGLGQGVVGFAAGWAAAAPLEATSIFAAGAGSAALTAVGLYPVTQVFQVEEDLARGDRTLAVTLGPRGALRFGSLCLALAAGAAGWLLLRRSGIGEAGAVVIGYALVILWNERLAGTLGGVGPVRLHARAMLLLNAATAGFLAFLAWQFVAR
jgi:1,4-dihydroxy-2-naphthoate octaprenyltransferase